MHLALTLNIRTYVTVMLCHHVDFLQSWYHAIIISLKKACFLSSRWLKLWPVGRLQYFSSLFFFPFKKLKCFFFVNGEKMRKKRSQSERMNTSSCSTGSKLFFRMARFITQLLKGSGAIYPFFIQNLTRHTSFVSTWFWS